MKAIRVHQPGSPEVLNVEEITTPSPDEGQILVQIEAIGLNFVDLYHRKGEYPQQPPFTPGMEAAGRVDAVGAGVDRFRAGDRVAYAMHPGAYAEYAVVPADRAVSVPVDVSARQAAATMLQGMTAHYLSRDTFRLEDWHTALVHAAAGGVGSLLMQMSKQRGARVIGTCSTDEKALFARQAGADELILYTETDFEQAVLDLTDGEGVNVVYDGVGRDTFLKGLNCLQTRGTMVLYGQASGPVDPLDPQMLRSKGSLFLTRPTLSDYVADTEELELRAGDLFDWLRGGELEVRIDRTFPLAQAAEAHRYMEARKTMGKVLLIP